MSVSAQPSLRKDQPTAFGSNILCPARESGDRYVWKGWQPGWITGPKCSMNSGRREAPQNPH